MEVFTVGDWLFAIETYQRLHDKAHGVALQCFTLRFFAADTCDGIADTRVLAEAEGEKGASPAWVRRKRGQLVAAGARAADVDAMTIAEFNDAIRPKGGAGSDPDKPPAER